MLDSKAFASSVVVITNGAPLPGVFSVSPTSGVALTTPFGFSASLWQDDDLPLTYAFGFLSKSVSQAFQPLQAASQLTYGSFLLPIGSDSKQFALTCAAQIFDSFGLNTTTEMDVSVTAGSSSALTAYLSSALSATADPEVVQSVLSTAGSELNTVKCRYAPNCANLNRFGCDKVENTCGSCLDGFVGDAGEGNNVCYNASTLSSARTKQATPMLRSAYQAAELNAISAHGRQLAGQHCNGDRFCPAFQFCNSTTFTCYVPSKICPSNCFNSLGKGECQFFSTPVSSAIRVKHCLLTDYDCAAKCVCSAGWGGSTCGTNATAVAAAKDSRAVLLQHLYNLTLTQDISPAAVSSWLSTLSALTFREEEISVDALGVIQNILTQIIVSGEVAGISAYLLKPMLDTMNRIYPIVTSKAALLEAYPSYSEAEVAQLSEEFVATQTDILREFVEMLLLDTVVGEDPYTSVDSGDIRLSVLSENSYSFGTSLAASAALSPLETTFGADALTATLSGIGSSVDVKLSLLQLQYSLLLTEALELNSHPVLLQIEDGDSVCTSAGAVCAFEFEMYNAQSVEYVTSNPNTDDLVTLCWHDNVVRETTYQCLGGYAVTAVCTGDFEGFITSYCPYISTAPVCGLLLDDEFRTDGCETLSFTATKTKCSCSISADDFAFSSRRRRMASGATGGAELSSKTKSTSVDAANVKTVIIPPVPPPIFKILGVHSRGLWIILAFLIAFVLGSIGAYLYYRWGMITDSDSQYDEVDYVVYANLLRTTIQEMLEVNREGREKMMFSPLHMDFAIKHLVQGGSTKAKICRNEVEDLLYVKKRLQEENDKLPYWHFVLNSEVEQEEEQGSALEEGEGPESEGRFERQMAKIRRELLDANGPLTLPVRVELTDQNDPMLKRSDTPQRRAFSSRLFNFRSPSLFFESRKVANDNGNSPAMGDIYGKNEDDPFSFTFTRREAGQLPPSRTFAFTERSPLPPLRESNSSHHEQFTIDFDGEFEGAHGDFGRDSPGLYEAVSFRSFHMGNSARSDIEEAGATPDVYFARRDEDAPIFYSNNMRLQQSPLERAIAAGTFGLPERSAAEEGGSRRHFFGEDVDYGALGADAFTSPKSYEDVHSTSPAQKTHTPASPTRTPGSAAGRARSERWSQMLDRVKRRAAGEAIAVIPEDEVAVATSPTATGHGAEDSPGETTESVDEPSEPLPVLLRVPAGEAVPPAGTLGEARVLHLPPVQRRPTRVLVHTESFMSTDTLTTTMTTNEAQRAHFQAGALARMGTNLEEYLTSAGADNEALDFNREELVEAMQESALSRALAEDQNRLDAESDGGEDHGYGEQGDADAEDSKADSSDAGDDSSVEYNLPVRRPSQSPAVVAELRTAAAAALVPQPSKQLAPSATRSNRSASPSPDGALRRTNYSTSPPSNPANTPPEAGISTKLTAYAPAIPTPTATSIVTRVHREGGTSSKGSGQPGSRSGSNGTGTRPSERSASPVRPSPAASERSAPTLRSYSSFHEEGSSAQYAPLQAAVLMPQRSRNATVLPRSASPTGGRSGSQKATTPASVSDIGEVRSLRDLVQSAQAPPPPQLSPSATSEQFGRAVARPSPSATIGSRPVREGSLLTANRAVSSTAAAGYGQSGKSPADQATAGAGQTASSVSLLARRYENKGAGNPLLSGRQTNHRGMNVNLLARPTQVRAATASTATTLTSSTKGSAKETPFQRNRSGTRDSHNSSASNLTLDQPERYYSSKGLSPRPAPAAAATATATAGRSPLDDPEYPRSPLAAPAPTSSAKLGGAGAGARSSSRPRPSAQL
jgi:hypothetical protein